MRMVDLVRSYEHGVLKSARAIQLISFGNLVHLLLVDFEFGVPISSKESETKEKPEAFHARAIQVIRPQSMYAPNDAS